MCGAELDAQRDSAATEPCEQISPAALRILAVVPTLNVHAPRLERLMASLSRLEGDQDLDVTVVVNRGAELPVVVNATGNPRFLCSHTIFESGLNLGFAGSILVAANGQTFTHLWVLQDDLVVDPSCLVELLGALDSDAGLGAISPTCLDQQGNVVRHRAGGRITGTGHIAQMLPSSSVPLEQYVAAEDLDFVMSRGLLIRAEAWHAVDGMDARFYPVGWTDVDLCTRLRSAGWKIATTVEATLWHEKGASTPRMLGSITMERNSTLYRAKIAGEATRPVVHPDIPREVLEIVAQSASSLALDLAARIDPAAQIDLPLVLRLLRRRARQALIRVLRRFMPRSPMGRRGT